MARPPRSVPPTPTAPMDRPVIPDPLSASPATPDAQADRTQTIRSRERPARARSSEQPASEPTPPSNPARGTPTWSEHTQTALTHLPVDDPDRYSLVGEHARGGLGRVVRAVDTRLGRTVAVKELLRK